MPVSLCSADISIFFLSIGNKKPCEMKQDEEDDVKEEKENMVPTKKDDQVESKQKATLVKKKRKQALLVCKVSN